MGHNASYVDLMGFVAYPSDQSVFVIADIEDRAVAIECYKFRFCPPATP
jgi:hypothetical protein